MVAKHSVSNTTAHTPTHPYLLQGKVAFSPVFVLTITTLASFQAAPKPLLSCAMSSERKRPMSGASK